MAKSIIDLDEQTIQDFGQYIEVDKYGYTESRKQLLDQILREDVEGEFNRVGSSNTTISFANITRAIVTIDRNCTINFSNLYNGDNVVIQVLKGASDIVTFGSATGTVDGSQYGRTSLFYLIEKYGSYIYVSMINHQLGRTLSSSNFSYSYGTIDSVEYFRSAINYYKLHFEGVLYITPNTEMDYIEIDISGWNIEKRFSGLVACSCAVEEGLGIILSSALISESLLKIFLEFNLAIGIQEKITVSGTFLVN